MNRRLLIVLTTVATLIWAGMTGAFMVDEGMSFGLAALVGASIVAGATIGALLLIAALEWALRGDR